MCRECPQMCRECPQMCCECPQMCCEWPYFCLMATNLSWMATNLLWMCCESICCDEVCRELMCCEWPQICCESPNMCCECVVSQSVVIQSVVSSSSSVMSQCLQVCSQAYIECHLLNILLYTFGELRLEPHLPLQASASPPAPSLLLGPSLRGNSQKGLIIWVNMSCWNPCWIHLKTGPLIGNSSHFSLLHIIAKWELPNVKGGCMISPAISVQHHRITQES